LPSEPFEVTKIDLTKAARLKSAEFARLVDVRGSFHLVPPSHLPDEEFARAIAPAPGIGTLIAPESGQAVEPSFGEALGDSPVSYLIFTGRMMRPGSVASLKRLPKLENLLLLRCSVTPEVLAEVMQLPHLRQLNLQESVGDEHLARLTLPNLRTIAVWGTSVTPQALVEFQRRHPNCGLDGLMPHVASELQSLLPKPPQEFALEFDGVDDGVEVPTLRFDGSHPITLEGWVTVHAIPTGEGVEKIGTLWGWSNLLQSWVTTGQRFNSRIWEAQDKFVNARIGADSQVVRLDQRQHVAVVYDGRELRQFVDGVATLPAAVAEVRRMTATDTAAKNDNFALGFKLDLETFDYRKQSQFFHGRMDEFRISKTNRYTGDFSPPARFESDADTFALYHFDEGTGDVLTDSSGNGHHGKIVGAKWLRLGGPNPSAITVVPADFALEFTGSAADKVEIPSLSTLRTFAEPLTVECYFTNLGRQDGHVPVLHFPGGALGLHANHRKWHIALQDATTGRLDGLIIGGKFEDGRRTHVAAVFQGGRLTLYVDGQVVDDKDVSGLLTANTARRGKFSIGPTPWKGLVDEVRVSRIARYKREFQPEPRFEPDADTLALYHCDEGAGDVLKDSSGNNHHGQIVGAKWVPSTGARATPSSPALALDFSGAPDARVELPLVLNTGQPFTVEMVVTRHIAGFTDLFQAKQSGTWFTLRHTGSVWRWQALIENRKQTVADVLEASQIGVPTHLAAASTGKELRLFVNGRLAKTMPIDGTPAHGVGGMFLTCRGTRPQPNAGTIHAFRLSMTDRYNEDFIPTERFVADQDTLILYDFREGAGDVLTDSSGNNHHGQIVGAKWVRAGEPGASATGVSLEFDGVDDQILIPDFAIGGEAMTWEWRLTAAARPDMSLGSVPREDGEGLWRFAIQNGGPQGVRVAGGQSGIFMSAGNSLPTETPTHAAAVFDGKEWALYIDGQRVAQGAGHYGWTPKVSNSFTASLGSDSGVPVSGLHRKPPFQGRLHGLRISKTKRYDENFAPPSVWEPDRDTLLLYRCDEGAGDVLTDSSGNNHHGKIVGAKWVRVGEPDASATGVSASAANLLDGVDVAKHGLVHTAEGWKPSQWTRTADGVRSANGRRELLRLPVDKLPGNYSLTVDFEVDSGNGSLYVGLPYGAPCCFFLVNGTLREGQRAAGFGHVDGQWEDRNVTTVLHDAFREHELHSLTIDVESRDGNVTMTATLDGKPLSRFDGPVSRLSLDSFAEFYDGEVPQLSVGATSSHYLIRRATLRVPGK
jgi:hypothetical protein